MKILIVNTDLDIGGGENSLVSFLANIDLNKYQVDLGVLQPKLGMADRLDPRINLIKLYEKPKLGEYDTAIGYKQGKSTAFITKIKAKKKIAFFRHGVIKYKGLSKLYYSGIYKKIDCLITLNEDLKTRLSDHFRIDINKIKVIEDIFDTDDIKEKSKEYKIKRDTDLVFSTVSRIVPLKRIDLIPKIAEYIEKHGIKNYKWYIIGGCDNKKYLENIKTLAQDCNVSKKIVFAGETENPLPYINESDIYIHPSDTECFSRAIMEALIVGRPVITTKTVSGLAQIIPGENGVLCDIGDWKSIGDEILKMAENIEEIKKKQPEYNQNIQKIMEKYYNEFA